MVGAPRGGRIEGAKSRSEANWNLAVRAGDPSRFRTGRRRVPSASRRHSARPLRDQAPPDTRRRREAFPGRVSPQSGPADGPVRFPVGGRRAAAAGRTAWPRSLRDRAPRYSERNRLFYCACTRRRHGWGRTGTGDEIWTDQTFFTPTRAGGGRVDRLVTEKRRGVHHGRSVLYLKINHENGQYRTQGTCADGGSHARPSNPGIP